jgi:hypothetical protein
MVAQDGTPSTQSRQYYFQLAVWYGCWQRTPIPSGLPPIGKGSRHAISMQKHFIVDHLHLHMARQVYSRYALSTACKRLRAGGLPAAEGLREEASTMSQARAAEAGGDGAGDGAADSYQAVQEQVTTVGEEVARVKSAALMRRFKVAVSLFVLLFVLVLFTPILAALTGPVASNLCLVAWNVLRLVFLLALAWVFRPQEDANAYLRLGADENDMAHLETQASAASAAACAGARVYVSCRGTGHNVSDRCRAVIAHGLLPYQCPYCLLMRQPACDTGRTPPGRILDVWLTRGHVCRSRWVQWAPWARHRPAAPRRIKATAMQHIPGRRPSGRSEKRGY